MFWTNEVQSWFHFLLYHSPWNYILPYSKAKKMGHLYCMRVGRRLPVSRWDVSTASSSHFPSKASSVNMSYSELVQHTIWFLAIGTFLWIILVTLLFQQGGWKVQSSERMRLNKKQNQNRKKFPRVSQKTANPCMTFEKSLDFTKL